ncbi:unnamed protein product [Oncorhynchus mykiss]|uniref:Delta-like protein n=1 Tax=Oncorhynchus mykiss TaxID=8022 RepID=A0A060X7C1_ONCMY|nr:unnamed protein product [Oncorhynchus mykiss]
MLNPGEQWQTYRHHGRPLSLEYRLRYRCDSNYYGPFCNKFCRPRDDFFGHFGCDLSGIKVCKEGWTGPECQEAVCRQGCHQIHGSCSVPGECKCHYGYQGALCDQCATFPGCVYGSCAEPWQCVCDVNWGGLLCNKGESTVGQNKSCFESACASRQRDREKEREFIRKLGFNLAALLHAQSPYPGPRQATSLLDHTTPTWVHSLTHSGGSVCVLVRQCDSKPCGRGATCQESPERFRCLCPPGWTGRTCRLDTNECDMGVCVHARSCRNLIGGYLCDCLPGWAGPNCDIRNSSCQGLCLNGGHCEDSVSGSRCLCVPGFSGKHCQTGPSPCDSTPCQHGGQCVDKEGRAELCSCPNGYSGTYCEVVVDLCNPNPCQQGVSCQSTEGGYMCACSEGYYGNECTSLKDPCHGQHCPGAMSDPARGGVNLYMVLVGVSALLMACGCAACALFLSRLHRRRKKTQGGPQEEGINNQRELVTLVRNLDRPAPLLPPLTSNTTAHTPVPDISNLEREKLNRFHYSDNQELEV